MSVHIKTQTGVIPETVLLPGDPLRAKWIAETFLEDVTLYNEVRGMLGFTGFYNGKKIAVQGTGMGVPSISIYVHELIAFYGAKKLIRVGTAGAYREDLNLRDIVLAMSASTNSNAHRFHFENGNFAPTASFELFMKAMAVANAKNIPVKAGNVLTSDIFYQDDPEYYKKWAAYGVLCVEMETSALYTIAAKFGAQALTLLSISDSLVTGEKIPAEERENTLRDMIAIALDCA